MQYAQVWKKHLKSQTLSIAMGVGIFVLAAAPRVLQLDYFLMVDENLWFERSAHFLQALVSGNLAQTVQTGHPGVTTMWSGALGLLLHYAQAASPGETLAQFAARMTTTPATLGTLRLLRLPLALLSALSVALAFLLGRRLVGIGAALAGVALMTFEPLFLAHSRVLHHDSPAADFSLLAVLAWLLYLQDKRRTYLFLAGVATALAVLSKVSSIFLLGFAGLTLLPLMWRRRRHLWSAVSLAAGLWLPLVGVVCLAIALAWPAVWAAPGTVWDTILGFITNESGPHANGTFFMGRPILDPGPLFYPVSLGFALTPLTCAGLLLALIGLGLAWWRASGSEGPDRVSTWRPATWLLLYAILFVIYMSVLGKKQERYILPAVVALDLLAGWGYQQIANLKPQTSPAWRPGQANPKSPRPGGQGRQIPDLPGLAARAGKSQISNVVPVLLLAGQFALAWPTAPYFSTFYNPLLGGAATAKEVLLIGRGEGLEQAVRYIQSQSDDQSLQIASWYGTTVATLVEGRMEVKDVAHPHFVLGSDYVLFYINQLQRQRPDKQVLAYVQREAPLYTVQLTGIDYVYVYRGQAISHPVDSFAPQNRLVNKASLAGFDVRQTPLAGARIPVHLYWVNEGLQASEHFYVRLVDEWEQDWAWGPCAPDEAFGDPADWQEGDIVESQCQLVVYPGTPPGEYWLRAGVITQQGTVVGQMHLSAEEGTVEVARPPEFPADEWVPVQQRIQDSLNDDLALIGYDYTPAAHKPGERLPITFYWRALRAPGDEYRLRLVLQGDGPGQYASWDGIPVNGRYPTQNWQAGEVVRDPWQLTLPNSLPSGAYELSLAWVSQNGSEAGRLALEDLTIQGREHLFSLAQPPATMQMARLGQAIRFLGYELQGAVAGESLVPGHELQVTLFWQAVATPERDYTVFVQLLDEANQVRAQHDGQPGDGTLATTTWAPGEYVRDEHRLALPGDLPAGDYRLIVGMYLAQDWERLPVFDETGQDTGNYITLRARLYLP